jgi:hypothetical protein
MKADTVVKGLGRAHDKTPAAALIATTENLPVAAERDFRCTLRVAFWKGFVCLPGWK